MDRIRRTAVAVAAAVIVAACSGSDSASTTEVNETTPATVSVPPTDPVETDRVVDTAATSVTTATTNSSLSTEPLSTNEPTATDPSTTLGSATTVVGETPETEVVAAIEFFEAQWETCLSELPACDQNAASERRQGGEVSNVQSNALRWNQNGYQASNVEALDYQVNDVQLNDPADAAVVVVCVVDPVALTEADGTVVDDNFYSSIVDWELQLVDGVWTSIARTTRGEAVVGEESNLCA